MSIQKMCLQCSFHSLYLGINLNFECSPPPKLIWPPQKMACWGGRKIKKFFALRAKFYYTLCAGGLRPPLEKILWPPLFSPHDISKGRLKRGAIPSLNPASGTVRLGKLTFIVCFLIYLEYAS